MRHDSYNAKFEWSPPQTLGKQFPRYTKEELPSEACHERRDMHCALVRFPMYDAGKGRLKQLHVLINGDLHMMELNMAATKANIPMEAWPTPLVFSGGAIPT